MHTSKGISPADLPDASDADANLAWPSGRLGRHDLERKENAMRRWNQSTVLIAAGGVGLLLVTRAVLRRWREYDLRDKVVLITGGSRGLGLIMARQLLPQGARLAICARDERELERAHGDLGHD